MTVQELLDVMSFCDLAEIVIRKTGHGQWIQGYRIGKEAVIYPAEVTAEIREMKGIREYKSPRVCLEEGEIIDCRVGFHLPMKVICRDCHKLPDQIGRLEVCSALPRNVPEFHGSQLTHNEFSLEINCYPDDYVPDVYIESKEVKKAVNCIEGQLCLEDIMGGME